MKLSLLGTFMFILFSSLVSAQILINEVMYDPGQCPDAQCEWIELYNGVDEIIDISQCSLMGKELEGNISANSYKIILRDYENFSYYFKEPENYQEITFSLVNSGKELILNGSEWCNTSFDYTYLTNDKLANNNNLTLERRSDGTWGESLTQGGSPGEENSISEISIEFENIFITEFLANPFGEDGADKPNGEWIELYNDGEKTIDLKGLYFTDIKKENELIIAQTKTMGASTLIHPNNYKVIYKDGDSDFSLNNYDFEELSLYVGDAKIAYTNFAGSTEGMSWSLIDDIWHQTLPTPNAENQYNPQCDWGLDIAYEDAIFQGDDLSFTIETNRLDGLKSNLSVKGEIQDLFGKKVESYSPWTNKEITTSQSKSYSPNLKKGSYQLAFWIEENSCEDYNEKNDIVKRLLAVNPEYQKNESEIFFIDFYDFGKDEEVSWGDTFRVKFQAYKGDETKNVIELWAEKSDKSITKRTKVDMQEKFSEGIFTVPLELTPNCNEKIADGSATLYIKGFGQEIKEKFSIDDISKKTCETFEKEVIVQEFIVDDTIQTLTQAEASENNYQEKISIKKDQKVMNRSGVIVYESSAAKTIHLVPYFFALSFILLLSYLIIKK